MLGGETRTKKCWNITSPRDSHMRAFGFKQLMGFLPTLARQRAWYPWVYDRRELWQCAKCGEPDETQEHLLACADHEAVKERFARRYLATRPERRRVPGVVESHPEPLRVLQTDVGPLQPWTSLGWRQGRVDPSWETTISQLRQISPQGGSIAATTRRLLRASLETWCEAIWLPRCKRTISQEQRHGLRQAAKLRRMRAPTRDRTRARLSAPMSAPTPNAPSQPPVPKLPPSFIESSLDRQAAHHHFLAQLMHGPAGH